ncbi:VIT family-domain-containing protein [Pyronema domesticum]|nr:VIT family-domain-containing protein [Pyronema domesticum]
MSLVSLKKVIFPVDHTSTPRKNRYDGAPLLPKTTPCAHPCCPRRPSSSGSSSSSVTAAAPPANKPWLSARTISDAIIGLSDGLTVPFALTAGLSAFSDTRVVIYGGCAELIAGSISMGLGGWLAGRGEAEFYTTTLVRTETLVYNYENHPEVLEMINGVLGEYHISADELLKDKRKTVKFLMKFHHGLDNDADNRTPLTSALTIAVGYFVGGAIPLSPYFFVERTAVMVGLWWSVGVMAVCLFLFGVGRTMAVGENNAGWRARVQGGVEMMAVGGVAAGASWGIVKGLGNQG